jgi:hypothetical protein
MRTVLEFERGSEPEHRRVFKGLSGKWRRRPYGAAARVDDVLEVWLQRPAVLYLVLVDRRQQSLEVAQGPIWIHQSPVILVERLRPFGHMGITRGDPELVVRPVVTKPDELDAGISVEIDQVAISGRAGGPCEHTDTAIVAVRHAVDLLLEDRPATDVPCQQERLTAAARSGKGDAVRRELLIGERAKVPPAAELDLAGQVGIALLVVPGVLDLTQ